MEKVEGKGSQMIHKARRFCLFAYLRKAYSTGFMAEFEYPKHPTSTKIVISSFDWQTSGGELIRAIWLT
jgi:hypothetical protein